MKGILVAVLLCLTMMSCGAHAPPPLVVTQFGGQGYIKGYLWGTPFELETWHIAIQDTEGELTYCSVLYLNVAGIQAHGTVDLSVLNNLGLDLEPAPKICVEEFGVLELMAPIYGLSPALEPPVSTHEDVDIPATPESLDVPAVNN